MKGVQQNTIGTSITHYMKCVKDSGRASGRKNRARTNFMRLIRQVCKTVVRPAMMYGAETWAVKKAQEKNWMWWKWGYWGWIIGVAKLDRKRNERIRGTAKVGEISKKLPCKKVGWNENITVLQLSLFALRFFHLHSGATGVFCLICRTDFRCAANLIAASTNIGVRRLKVRDLLITICVHCALLCLAFLVLGRSSSASHYARNGVILRGYNVSNTVAGRLQFDNSQECIAKKRQWRRHANANTLERNASIIHYMTAEQLNKRTPLVPQLHTALKVNRIYQRYCNYTRHGNWSTGSYNEVVHWKKIDYTFHLHGKQINNGMSTVTCKIWYFPWENFGDGCKTIGFWWWMEKYNVINIWSVRKYNKGFCFTWKRKAHKITPNYRL